MHASLTAPWFSGPRPPPDLDTGGRGYQCGLRASGGRAGPESRIIMIGWRPEPSRMRRFRSRSHIMESSS
jgi:hypothetical protein